MTGLSQDSEEEKANCAAREEAEEGQRTLSTKKSKVN
jgi:hypothetical protein